MACRVQRKVCSSSSSRKQQYQKVVSWLTFPPLADEHAAAAVSGSGRRMPTRGIERIALVSAAVSPMIVFYMLLEVGAGSWTAADLRRLAAADPAQWRALRDTLQQGPALLTMVRAFV